MLNSFVMPITILDKPIWSILLNLVGGIYDFICYVYDIFFILCRFNLFGEGDYQHIVSNIYIILGIVMTFVLAYSLLRAVINPDEFAKGETSFPKLAKNVVISLAIIVLLPTVFDVAFKIQNVILSNGVVENLILGYSTSNNDNSGLKIETSATSNINNPDASPSGGRVIAYYTYKAFFVPNTNKDVCNGTDEEGCRQYINGNGDLFLQNGQSLVAADSAVLESLTFSSYADFSEAVAKGQIKAYVLLLPVVGFFELIVLVNFTIDMALRVVKLAFYQIIAPIPVICRIIPGGKLKDTFSKWLKQVISLFFEVFVRIASLSFGVLLIRIVVNNFIEYDGAVFEHKGIIGALLIMAVIMFVKQMPKLIGDLFGIDTGGMKLGFKEKLREGGAFAAGNAVGALISSRGNPFAAYRAMKHGMKNADFKAIGMEHGRARDRRDAIAAGATRTQLMGDSLRRTFGFQSSNKADDYAIENADYTVTDENGNQLVLNRQTVDNLEERKRRNNTQIGEINSSMSGAQNISSDNNIIIGARKTFKNDGLDEIHKDDSKIVEILQFRNKNGVITSLSGNYNSLKQQLEKNYQDGNLTDDDYNEAKLSLARLEKTMQEKFVTAAVQSAGNRKYRNADGTVIDVDDGGKFNTNYEKLLNDLRAGVLKDENGHVIDINTFVDAQGNQLQGWDLINAAFQTASGYNNTIAVELNNMEREKREIEQRNKIIDGYFEQRTKQQEELKNSNSYKARKASSEYNDHHGGPGK